MPKAPTLLTHWLPPLLWMTLIFVGSTDVLSAGHTSRFVGPFLHWLLGAGYTAEKAEFGHFLVRKAGHFSEYAVLSVLLWRALGSLPPLLDTRQPKLRYGLAAGLAGLYAASDEFHQSFVPSRTASPVDVIIDASGALLGLLMFLGLLRLLRHNQPPFTKPNSS